VGNQAKISLGKSSSEGKDLEKLAKKKKQKLPLCQKNSGKFGKGGSLAGKVFGPPHKVVEKYGISTTLWSQATTVEGKSSQKKNREEDFHVRKKVVASRCIRKRSGNEKGSTRKGRNGQN